MDQSSYEQALRIIEPCSFSNLKIDVKMIELLLTKTGRRLLSLRQAVSASALLTT